MMNIYEATNFLASHPVEINFPININCLDPFTKMTVMLSGTIGFNKRIELWQRQIPRRITRWQR